MLGEAHDIVLKERRAVEKLDHSAVPGDSKIKAILQKMDEANYEPSEVEQKEFPSLTHLLTTRRQIDELLRQAQLPPNSTIYEIGADHCMISNLLRDYGHRVIATDITHHLSLATRPNDPDLCRILADMNRVPIKNEAVDVVWATAAVHHSWNLPLTFTEARRILKPNGRLVLSCEPMPAFFRYFFGKDFGSHEKELGINENWIARKDWIETCRSAGFKKISLHFPSMGEEEITTKLKTRGLSSRWIPLLRPFYSFLQVSIHLTARKDSHNT
jgi:SAM-dependent methyltransferase